MKAFRPFAAALALVVITSPIGAQSQAPPAQCGIQQPAFCETFDQPTDNTGGNVRSGQLDGVVWGVSRALGATNSGQNQILAAESTQLQTCNGTTVVQPPGDVIVCNGQLREATNDGTGVTALAMYPKQPFDFADRTGTITFDVSNDSQGMHTAWPELWMSDQPVPVPFTHFSSWIAAPRNGFGLRLGGVTGPGEGNHIAAACPIDSNTRWTISSVVVARNYAIDDEDNFGTIKVVPLDCVISPSGPDSLNHVEVRVSQNQIDVYATDAGTLAPLHHLATVPNANLTFSRGLIWLEDVHYNANKFGFHNQREHTFAWDNVGFDGPLLARDLAFDVPDAQTPVGSNYPDQVNLGWAEAANTLKPQTVKGVSGTSAAAAAILTFNFVPTGQTPPSLEYVVNGHPHSVAWPYSDAPCSGCTTMRTLAVPVPLGDIVEGTNIVGVSASEAMMYGNMDLILVGAGGVVSVPNVTPTPPVDATPAPTPGVSQTPTATSGVSSPTPIVIATPTPTAAPAPISTPAIACQVLVQVNGQINSVSRPASFCTDQP